MRRGISSWMGWAVALLLLAGFSGTANAQVLYGSLTGNVTDPSGAAIPGAKVEALNTGTGISRQADTDTAGAYTLNNLQSGVYKITIVAGGFQTTIIDSVTVNTNEVKRLDLSLKIAVAATSIEVSAPATAMLQTDRADVNTRIDAKELNSLPIMSSAGRNFQALYRIVPGFETVGEGVSSDGGNPQRSMSGFVNGTSRQNSLTRIDGASNTYMWLPSNTAYVPPAESIESVSVVTNSFDAEQGHAVGAVVNVVTKAGTNEFHGSTFWDHTDNALRAVERFKPANYRKTKYIFNQYGASVGGPIKKNKLFFFADWEGTARRMFANSTVTVPNPASIFDSSGNANFSAALPTVLYDPNSGSANGSGRQPFTNNTIPASRIDGAAKTLLGRISTAGFLNNNPLTGATQNNYQAAGSAKMDRNTVDAKVNWVATERMNIFGRYSISPTTYFDPPRLGDAMGGATGGGQLGTAPSRIQNVGLGGTYTISPTMLIDMNAGFTRQRLGATYDGDLGLGNFGVNTLHIPGSNGDTTLAQGIPGFNFVTGGVTSASSGDWNGIGNIDTGNPFLFRDNQYVMNANMSWMKGRHNLRYGIEHTRSQMNHFQPQGGSFQNPRGAFRFNGNMTALLGGAPANKINSLADFLLGLPTEVGKAVQNANPNSLRWQTWSWYIRDSWQVTSSLTVNVGLRWEYYPFATTDHGGVKLFDPATGYTLIGGYGSTPLDDGVDVGHGQFLPRIGIAQRLGQNTVIRAGYGMTADSNNWRFFRNNYPATTNSDIGNSGNFFPAARTSLDTPAANYAGTYPTLGVGIPFVAIPDITSGAIPVPNGVSPGNTVPFDFRRGYIHMYNLTVQHEFGKIVAEAGYVGNKGVRLLTNENINSAPPGGGDAGRLLYPVANKNWGNVNCFCPDGPSWYNSLQTKATWRFHGDSSLGAVYTLSRAVNWTDNEEESVFFGTGYGYLMWPYPTLRERNLAVAGYDRTHNFNMYGVYELPFGKGQKYATSGIASKIAGGWQLNGVLTKMSGVPFTIAGGGSQVNAPGNVQTADQVGPVNILGGVGPRGGDPSCGPTNLSCHYFDPSAFRPVPGSQVRFGNVGRNTVRGPGMFNLDASVFRNFKVTERVSFEVRAEMFGVTNTPHLNNPGLDPTNTATFGVITSTLNSAGRGTGSGGERWTYFSGKVVF